MTKMNSPTFKTKSLDDSEVKYNFDLVKRIPFYFGSKGKSLLGWLHTTNSTQHSNTGIIICPPIGIEYLNSYRSLRYVADYFALAGIPALRFDYHGTGDSSGIEEDDNRLKEWLFSINQAIEHMKKSTNCEKIGLFGFRMGATFASLIAESTAVEFLILWAALNNGKKYIREIKLIQMTGKIQTVNDDNTFLEAGGMGYWSQTANDIANINLKNLIPQARRILIIPREEQITDTELLDAWSKNNLNIEQKNHVGSTLMLVDAHLTVIPHQAIQKIVQWVKKDHDKTMVSNKMLKLSSNHILSTNISFTQKEQQDKSTVIESIHYFGSKDENVAILTETEQSKASKLPTIIIANSGTNHRVGPSRLYVSLARELSVLGFSCLRIDMPGIGDSIISNREKENIEYLNSSSSKILEAIKILETSNEDKKFILMGLCSGAFFSFHAALDLTKINITEIILINPLTFYWEEGMTVHTSPTVEFRVWNWYKQAFSSKDSWVKLLKGKINFKSLFAAILNRIKSKFTPKILYRKKDNSNTNNFNPHRELLSSDLTKIATNKINILFIFARSDPGYDILMTNAGQKVRKLRKSGKLNIKFIENADHTFSKYKPRCQLINTITQHFKEKITSNA